MYRALEKGLSFKTTFGNVLTLTPPLTTTTESTIPLLARMFNPTVVFSQVKDGKIVQTDKKFFDPFEGEFVT